MSLTDNKISTWTSPIVGEADQPSRTASEMKAVFDANSNELKTALNNLIDALVASGGSAEIGSAAFSDVEAGTVLSQLEALRELLDDRVESISIGTVTTGAAGSSASVSVSGTMPHIVLSFTIPKGDAGDPTAPHHAQHAIGGDDAVTPASIGAATADHNHNSTYAAIDHTHTGTYEPARLQFTSVAVDTDDFAADTTYDDYGYKADITLTGVTVSMVADVVFDPVEAASGNFAAVVSCGTGVVTIYAAAVPEEDFTIPTIIVWR